MRAIQKEYEEELEREITHQESGESCEFAASCNCTEMTAGDYDLQKGQISELETALDTVEKDRDALIDELNVPLPHSSLFSFQDLQG